jgi:hypothetical protein
VAVSAVGTIRWTFDDDAGVSHALLIPGWLYIPDSPARLFSPQHWAQERKDDFPKRNGTWQATFADRMKLVWGQEKFSRRITFDKSNVATFSTTAGCKNFRMFQACLKATEEKRIDRATTHGIRHNPDRRRRGQLPDASDGIGNYADDDIHHPNLATGENEGSAGQRSQQRRPRVLTDHGQPRHVI